MNNTKIPICNKTGSLGFGGGGRKDKFVNLCLLVTVVAVFGDE